MEGTPSNNKFELNHVWREGVPMREGVVNKEVE
jgi:hypothetical protein